MKEDEEEFYDEDYEEDIYGSDELVDELMESDEIEPSEDAFMKGYDRDADQTIHRTDYDETFLCPNCGKVLKNESVICYSCGQDIEESISM